MIRRSPAAIRAGRMPPPAALRAGVGMLALGGGGGGGLGYTLPTPFVIHDFAAAAGWYPTNGTAPIQIARDDAKGGLVFTDTSAASVGSATNNDVGTFSDPAGWGVIATFADVGGDPERQMSGAGAPRIGRGGSGGSGGTYNFDANPGSVPFGGAEADMFRGIVISGKRAADLPGLPTGAGTIGLRIENSQTPYGRYFRLIKMLGNAAGRPTVCLTFDDALAAQETTFLPMLSYYGFKGTAYVPWDDLGTGGRMSLSGVQALAAAGWAICLDGTSTDAIMNVKHANPAAAVAELNLGRAWLAANSFPAAGGDHFCYPNGIIRATPTRVQKTGVSGAAGQKVLTLADTSGIAVGDRVVGVGIADISRVASMVANTSITLDTDVAGALSAGRIKTVNDSNAFHTDKLQAALRTAGFKSGRTTLGGPNYTRFGVGDAGLVISGHSSTDATAAMLTGYVDGAVAQGATAFIYFHGALGSFNPVNGTDDGTASSGLNTGTAPMNAFLAYLKAKVVANEVSVLTVPEWWARDCASPEVAPGASWS